MKKVVKFLCLLLIAALIVILVMKNAVKADDDILSGSSELTVNNTSTISINFPCAMSSFSGTVGYTVNGDDDPCLEFGGEVAQGNVLAYVNGDPKQSFTFTVRGSQAGSATINVRIDQAVPAEEGYVESQYSDSMSVTVTGDDPVQNPSISISIASSSINARGTTHITVDSKYPENDTVSFESSDTSVATVSEDGAVFGYGEGTATITATTASGAQDSVSVTVTPGDYPPVTEFTVSPSNINMKVTDDPVTITASEDVSTTIVFSKGGVVNAARTEAQNQVLVSPIAEGDCELTITSADGQKNATVSVHVSSAETPDNPIPELTQGKTTLIVNGDSTTVSSSIPVTWSSSDTSIAVISAESTDTTAIVIAKNAGRAEITGTAKNGGKTASVFVNVKQNEQAAPELVPSSSIKLEVGKSAFISANQSVTWASSDTSVVTVNAEGLVIGKKSGEAKIIATNKGGKSTSIIVTVIASQGGSSSESGNNNIEDPDDVNTNESIESTSTFAISPRATQTLNIGESVQIKVTKGTASSWKSSKPAVASVDNNGKVTANSSGIAYITAIASDGSVAQLKIKVKDENGNDPDPGSEANNSVPSTGEASTSLLLVVGTLTFIIATFIFRKKTR